MTEAEVGSLAEGALVAAQPAAPVEGQGAKPEGDRLDTAETSPAGSPQAIDGAAAASGEAPGGSEASSGSDSEGEEGRQPTAAEEAAAAAAAGAAHAEPENAAEAGGNSNSGAADGSTQKRDYVKWRPEEEEAFYAALRGVAGQKPEVVIREVTQRVGTKDYAQVRHYYYRLIKRLNKILGEDAKLDTKHPLQVHRAMVKFWEVFVQKGMRGTCMIGITKKPRKQKELSTTVQRGVKAVLQRTKKAAAAAAAGSSRGGTAGASRKRKPRAADAAAPAAAMPAAEAAVEAAGGGARGQEAVGAADDVEMADAEALRPAKQRRTAGPAMRKQRQLAAAEAQIEAVAAATAKAAKAPEEGSSQSHTGAHEGGSASAQPASSSHTAGSQRQAEVQPARHVGGAAHSFRSSSNAGLSGAVPEGSMGQVGGRLRLQLMPLDGATAQAMAAVGHHPFLELMLSSSKSLASVLRHLGSKWHLAATAAASTGASAGLFVHPPADCPITLRGVCWGGQDCDSQLKVGDIHTTLHCPAPFQLLYAWGRPAGSPPAVAASAGAAAASQEASGAAAAAAAAAAVPPGKQASSRAALPRQRSESAEADELAAELRQAISAAAAAAAAEPASEACMPQEAAQVQYAQQQQQQQQRQYPQQVQQPQLGSFMQLLNGGAGEMDALVAGAQQAEFNLGAAPAALAATPVPAATPVAVQPMAVLPPPRFDEQPPAAGALPLPAVPPKTVQRRRQRAKAAAAASTGSTPEAGAEPGGMPAGEAAGEAAPVTDPRKPRGLLGLLQTTPTPAAKAGKVKKQQSTQRKRPQSSQRKKLPQQQQQQQAGAAGVPQEYGGAPMPVGYGPFMWAHMHPHLQQPQPVAVLHQQQLPAVLQAEPQMPILQQPQPVQPQPQPLDFDAGGDTLFQLLDGGAHPGEAFVDMPVLGSPAKDLPPGEAVPPLPGCDDFSLKSWPNLSPPSNFQLPDGFDSGVSPTGKAAGAAQPARLTGGGAKSGAAAAAAAGAQAGRAGGARALDSVLGPTDFSLLLASVGGGDAPQQQQPQQAAAHTQPQPAGGPAGHQLQAEQPPPGHAAAHQALEAIFGGTSLFGTLLGAPVGNARQAQQALGGGMGAAAPLQLVPDKALADLAFDFGSLLGVGDSPPSWPAGGDGAQGQPRQPGQQAPASAAALGDRPFAALFGK